MLTLGIIKPDAMRRHLEHEILAMITVGGFAIHRYRCIKLTVDQINQLYHEHKEKAFFPEIVGFMHDQVIVLGLEHVEFPEETVERLRVFMGATRSSDAHAGTIRYRFGNKANIMENAIHGSASDKDATREIALFFGDQL